MIRVGDHYAIAAVIFDMDGVLIDSEPIWRRVELDIFNRLGCNVTDADALDTMGVPILEVVRERYAAAQWEGPSVDAVVTEIVNAMIGEIATSGAPMVGVLAALAAVRGAGLPIAIASSSSAQLIEAVVKRLGIGEYIDTMCSADDEVAGKPNPAVYLRAAERLGVDAAHCLAIEDSPNGVRSALAAGMVCAVIPDPYSAEHPVMSEAHFRLDSLEELTDEWLGALLATPGRSH